MTEDQFRALGDTSADAAGLSILAGLARPDEGLPTSQGGQGAIDHALRFTLPSGDVAPQYIYPASHVVDESTGADKLPLGARLRLANTPAIDAQISAMGPEAQIIATAMQQYGLVLADIGSADVRHRHLGLAGRQQQHRSDLEHGRRAGARRR